MGRAYKGSAFERTICRRLSEWWTRGDRDDIFWRTGGSGGRAKIRGRKGAETYGQNGDVAATHPIGDPFIKVFSVELKRGYNRVTFADVLDRPTNGAQQEWEKWMQQTLESWKQSGAFYWLLIHKRDGRSPLVYVPWKFVECLEKVTGRNLKVFPQAAVLDTKIRIKRGNGYAESKRRMIVVLPLDTFLLVVLPEDVKRVLARRENREKITRDKTDKLPIPRQATDSSVPNSNNHRRSK